MSRHKGKVPTSGMTGGTAHIMQHIALSDRRYVHRGWDLLPEHRLQPNVIFTPNTGCTNHKGTFTEGCSWCARFAAIAGKYDT